MTDADVRELASRAGISVEWIDYADKRRRVSVDVLRRILAALGLPCDSRADLQESRRALDVRGDHLPKLLTAVVGAPISLPDGTSPSRVRLIDEGGRACEPAPARSQGGCAVTAPRQPGYYTLECGDETATVAVAPPRCYGISDLAPDARIWGLAVQVYGLPRPGCGGIGDTEAVARLAASAARHGADAVALSPTHALFSADPKLFSPYSPSNRLFHSPLYADPACVFGSDHVARAIEDCGLAEDMRALERMPQVDWPRAAHAKLVLLRRLFEDAKAELADRSAPRGADFAAFVAEGGAPLQEHALFEAVHAKRLAEDPADGYWPNWPAAWRDRASGELRQFAQAHADEILFHCFLQWIAEHALAAAQRRARQSGMRVGLIADVAVGTNSGGSSAWARPQDMLVGLNVGAPPDLFNTRGQDWGLTTFSPHALVAEGFAPFLATLRAAMRCAGGVRIDHAMGLMRLWVIPDGAAPQDGAYLAYPLDDLLRLTALESHRHRAIVIGEDLGTVPAGFRERLADIGISGMRVLWFERDGARFRPPNAWSVDAVAMTSTHDLPTVAGWWHGSDISVRAACGLVDEKAERRVRDRDRKALWQAFRAAEVAADPMPAPDDTARAADAAVRFLARTSSRFALLPVEDALALEEQPNLPGTIDEHPNWRRKYKVDVAQALDSPEIGMRLAPLARRDRP